MLQPTRFHSLFSASVGIVLLLPLTLQTLPLIFEHFEIPENRQETTSPRIKTLSDLRGLPTTTTSFLESRFPYRDLMIREIETLRSAYLKQGNEHVIVGEDDWLFFTGDDIFEDLMGLREFDREALQKWFEPYIEKQKYLESQGIDYLLVIIPNKSTIYKEKLPWWVRANLRATRLDQIREAQFTLGADLTILDLTDAILGLKTQTESFWYNDTHWSGPALKLGLELIFEQAQSSIGTLDFTDFNLYAKNELVTHDGDLVTLIGLNGRWPTRERSMLRFESPADSIGLDGKEASIDFNYNEPSYAHPAQITRESGNGKVLVFHDSFLRVAKPSPLLADNHPIAFPFKEATLIWEHPTLERLKRLSKQFKPNLVIEQRAERKLIEGNLK